MNVKKTFLIIFIITVCAFSIIIYMQRYDRDTLINKEIKKTQQLAQNYTLKQATKAGIIDVTEAYHKPQRKIEQFLAKAEQKKWGVLRTIKETSDGDLVVTNLFADDRTGNIRAWQYFIKSQTGLDPDKRFNSTYQTTENGVVKVYLKNIPNSWSGSSSCEQQADLNDKLLYRYDNLK